MYTLTKVTKTYHNGHRAVPAVQNVSLIIGDGEWLPIQGRTGHGKTTLLQLGTGPAERRRRVMAALDSVGLADRARHLPSELSGGQQRVAVARALVKQPTVLLADEPTGNLDERTRDEIIALLERLWRDRGLTLVMVTHDSGVFARRARRVGVMNSGRLSIRQDTRPAGGTLQDRRSSPDSLPQ